MPGGATPRDRLRTNAAKAFGVVAGRALDTSRRLQAASGPTLEGDRWVEWSFCLARLAEGSGRTLDFGADIGFLSLAAAQRGHDVIALDREQDPRSYEHERVAFHRADILDRPLENEQFDQIINCSSVEHVGLAGRYGNLDSPDGDLDAMRILAGMLAPGGTMILTVPVGRDQVCQPYHRIYGEERLPRLLEQYQPVEAQYWAKLEGLGRWQPTDRAIALATRGSATFYSLGLFVLRAN